MKARHWPQPQPQDYVKAWRLISALTAETSAQRIDLADAVLAETDDVRRLTVALANLTASELVGHGETPESLTQRIALATLQIEADGVRA